MILRLLLVLVAVAGLSISGCEKDTTPPKAPTEAEVEEVVEDAAEVVEDAKEVVEEAKEGESM